MNKYLLLLFLAAAIYSIVGCDDSMSYQPKGDYISGYAVFADTNFVNQGGYYAVALYSTQKTPYTSVPHKSDSLKMSGFSNPYYFRINNGEKESCYLAIVWKKSSNSDEIPLVLATFGCDTTDNCQQHKLITFPNFTGMNYNIICWADTSKKLN